MRRQKLDNRSVETNRRNVKRSKNQRNQIQSILIACEDSVSAPAYFGQIISNLIKNKRITQDSIVIVDHNHSDPKGVLNDLLNYKEGYYSYKDFEGRWIVIDRDQPKTNGGGHTSENFNTALQQARAKKVEVAYSNDCFELWYLLHFVKQTAPIHRDDIFKKIIESLKKNNSSKFKSLSTKNIKSESFTKEIYNVIEDLQDTAIRNAEELLQSYSPYHNPEKDNPATTVHRLVQYLNNLI